MKHIVVIGGGVSGFLAVNLFLSFSSVSKITHIYSEDMPPIGVGEGTTPAFLSTLKDIGIDLPKFMEATSATIKRAVHYKGWWENDFMNVFSPKDFSQEELDQYMKAILNKEVFDGDSFIGIHFDCFKAINFFKERAKEDSRYNHVGGIAEVEYDLEKVHSVFVNEETILADYYVNAAQRELFGEEYTDVTDYNDTAVVTHVNGKGDFQYTEALAMDAGWRWAIPLKDKIGYGYVFDSKEISVEEATKELSKSVGQDIDTRVVKYQSKHANKAFLKNACTLGLAQNFLDPLDTLSLLSTSLTIKDVRSHFLFENTYECNMNYLNRMSGFKQHLNTQYKLSIGTTPYWIKRQNRNTELSNKDNSISRNTLVGRGL